MFGYRRGTPLNVLLLLGTMSFLLYVDRVNLSTAAGPIMKELGLSNTQLGLAFSAFGYSYIVFQMFGGWFADRFGSQITLLICGVIWAATTLGMGMVESFSSLLAIRFVLGIGEGATLPAASRALTNWTPKEKRGFARGITRSCSRFGNAITPPCHVHHADPSLGGRRSTSSAWSRQYGSWCGESTSATTRAARGGAGLACPEHRDGRHFRHPAAVLEFADRDPERWAAAGGLAVINSFANLSGFFGPAIIGWASQGTGNTQASNLFLSAILILASVLIFLIPARLVNR